MYFEGVTALNIDNGAGIYLPLAGNVGDPMTGPIVLQAGNAGAPAIGWGDTGFYEAAANIPGVTISGSVRSYWDGGAYRSNANNGFSIMNEVSSLINPVYAFVNSLSYGLGGVPGSGNIALIANSKPGLIVNDVGAGVIVDQSYTAGITASITQSQGQQPLVSNINEFSIVANPNDATTMPEAIGGRSISIINNGVNVLQIFPASGDDLGAGVDTSITLASGSNVIFKSYNAVNWEQF